MPRQPGNRMFAKPTPASILVIEADIEIAGVLRDALEDEGYEVDWEDRGREGLEIAATLQPHVIVLDLMLPDIDGRRILRDLKQSVETRAIPVIVCSAFSGRMTQEEASMAF